MSSSSASETDRLVEEFAGYLRRERGVSTFTVDLYVADVRRFVADLGNSDLRELTPADVSHAVLGQVGAWSPALVRRFGCALRSFLRYCFVTGLVERDLSGAALPVSGRRRSLLPQGITPAQETALLRACDRRRSSGRRDYAVILLILRLGLRANEVATLRLDDMDWRAGQLTVHGKGNRVDQLPLPVDVGEAIAAYLCRGRPRSATAREVFPKHRVASGATLRARRNPSPHGQSQGCTGGGVSAPDARLSGPTVVRSSRRGPRSPDERPSRPRPAGARRCDRGCRCLAHARFTRDRVPRRQGCGIG
ncbi:MAG: site-specific integrase, partial [Actinobacteria bacterium]|nr:site-specific integrase [Actinomycetota bacterium]